MTEVVSSSYVLAEPQQDGRVWVTETHVLSEGDPHTIMYLATPPLDYAAVLSGRATAINAQLAAGDG